MPIRHCQKCSLKVLIDDSQANVSPFYCQRCTAALKSDGGASVGQAVVATRKASAVNLTPVPAPMAVAVASPPAAGKTSTVKVFCPYCKASFNGRIPAKPARGSCPLCQKDLILLPTGDIRPAADFDLAKWTSEQSAADQKSKESGTMALVKKFAASPPSTASNAEAGQKVLEDKADAILSTPTPASTPKPAEETQVPEEGVELPSWLDDESKRLPKKSSAPVEPAAETDTEAEPVRLEDLEPQEPEPAPPPPPPPAPRKSPAPKPITSAPAPAAKPAAAAAAKKGTARREKTERRTPSPDLAEAGPTGGGKVFLALLLTALPLIACPILLSMKEKLEASLLKPMGARFTKGFLALNEKLFPPEEAPPAPRPAPKAVAPEPEEPVKLTAADKQNMRDEIDKRWTEFKREDRTFSQKSVGATPAEKAEFAEAEARIKGMKSRYDELRANYRKLFGEDYDPTKQ